MDTPTGKRARIDDTPSDTTHTNTAEDLHLDDAQLYMCDSQGASRDERDQHSDADHSAEQADEDPLQLHLLLVSILKALLNYSHLT